VGSICSQVLNRLVAALGGILVLCTFSIIDAHAQTQGTGAFRHLAEIETRLTRGVSSKADVQELLGVPNGSGGSQFSALGATPQQVWYYEDVETTGAEPVGSVVRMKMRMQFVIIFFKGDIFDGYLWTTQMSGDVNAR